jgi:hypothetical protein
MSVQGRISVDVVFHDTDGTNAINVVSLQDSQEYTTGKVAIISGTAGTAAVSIQVAPTSYRNASGELVSFSEIETYVVQSGQNNLVMTNPTLTLNANSVAVIPQTTGDFDDSGQLPTVSTVSGTSTYTIILYGS